jgi:hypothetical protein
MDSKNEVIVVAPEKYKDIARTLTHEIYKRHGVNTFLWDIQQYEKKECELNAGKYVLLIGNEKENSLTKCFLPVIKSMSEMVGACYGYDCSKALVFGRGDLEQKNKFIEYLEVYKGENKYKWWILTGVLGSFFPLSILGYFLGKKEKELEKLCTAQTAVAIELFMENHFEKWVGIKS